MKLTVKDLATFVKNNPQHFKDLDPKIQTYFNRLPVQSCGVCPKAAQAFKDNSLDFSKFILCDESVRKLIVDKSKILLDDVVEIEDFSVNSCSESDQSQ